MSSYSNRIAAYNTKMKVYGSQMSQPEELEPVQDDTNYVTFAFYENIEDAAKTMDMVDMMLENQIYLYCIIKQKFLHSRVGIFLL